MTEQEFSELLSQEDEVLLEELGESLRATPALDLPADFARRTAQDAEQRFERMSGLRKLAVRMDPVLGAPIASRLAFPWTLAVLFGTLGGGLLGRTGVAGWGLLLVALVILWKLLEVYSFPVMGQDRARFRSPALLFYLLPGMCALATSFFCGGVVSALSLFSINFRSAGWNSVLLGPVCGLAVLLYLLSALTPTWRALQRQSVGRAGWMFPVQFLHAGWFAVLASVFGTLHDSKASLVPIWASVGALALVVSVALSKRPPLEEEGRPALWTALSKSLRSLLLGGLPISAVLVGSYQASLTRQIDQPELYQQTLREVGQWVEQQKAIRPEDNGWTELQEPFTNRSSKVGALALQLRQGGVLYDRYEPSYYKGAVAWELARKEFLKAIPAIERANARPYFSYVNTLGFSYQSLVPNFLLCRAGSQGLEGLAREAVERGQSEESLKLQLTNFRWSGRVCEGTLISLMIGVAQQSIAISCVEHWVFETHPDASQLRRMLKGLQQAEFARDMLETTMKREVYLADKAFSELLEKSAAGFESIGGEPSEGAWRVLIQVLPRSYWKSEHNAYINLELAGLSSCHDLARPNSVDPGDFLPFSYAARQLAPATHRAQTQFMCILARFEALKTVVALEIFHREQGAYPDRLEQLVPNYLPELPKAVMSPKVWSRKPTFFYRRLGSKYELISESPLYETIHFKSRQSFGPDGTYDVERTNQ